jgi:hypothetical protein
MNSSIMHREPGHQLRSEKAYFVFDCRGRQVPGATVRALDEVLAFQIAKVSYPKISALMVEPVETPFRRMFVYHEHREIQIPEHRY